VHAIQDRAPSKHALLEPFDMELDVTANGLGNVRLVLASPSIRRPVRRAGYVDLDDEGSRSPTAIARATDEGNGALTSCADT
jgi:hypothetical protein